MTPRTELSIGAALSGKAKAEFENQKKALGKSVEGQALHGIRTGIQQHAQGLFREYFQTSEDEAGDLARLLIENTEAVTDLVGQWVERVALLRALLALGLGGQLIPYIQAAARGASAAMSLDGRSMVVFGDMPKVKIPILERVDSGRNQAGVSHE